MNDKKLYRSRTERMIAGVCGGLANYFSIDPTIVRLIFVLLLITGSAGFWIYIVLMLVVPEEPTITNPNPDPMVDVMPDRDDPKQDL